MNLKEIAKFAPILAGALGGPGAAVIATLVSHVFGAKEDLSDLPDLLSTNPDKVADLEERLSQNNAQEVEAEVSDKEDARKMATSLHLWMPTFLTISNSLVFYTAVYFSFFRPIDTSDQTIANILIGILGAAFASNNQFFTGTTHQQQQQKY